ncbi:hypothetical protein H0H93_007542 [Arthromyces matolae]|nr:hypothetical protein H0H93_007542 [Arthromyces matolae]
MPAAHDIYAEELSELCRGYPLYYPEPPPDDGPMEIGDVGFLRHGAFYRLFNVSRSPDDPAQRFGVPEGFEMLSLGRIRVYEAALEPGPLHSKSVFTLDAEIGIPSTALPLDASFHFKCTSKRGAIVVQETQMRREEAFQNQNLEDYLLRHCQSWYDFAKQNRITLGFGQIMLVTECSKTAAWSSAVYSNSSKEFGVSFSVGGSFVSCAPGISASAGIERSGPIERRRSMQRPTTDGSQPLKNHTIFFKAIHLGTRRLYYKSVISLFIQSRNRKPSRPLGHLPIARAAGEEVDSLSSVSSPSSASSLSEVTEMIAELPDFHPASPLLALMMEDSANDFAFVHDDEWCSPTSEASELINDYVQFHFEDYDNLARFAPAEAQSHPIAEEPRDGPTVTSSSSGLPPSSEASASGSMSSELALSLRNEPKRGFSLGAESVEAENTSIMMGASQTTLAPFAAQDEAENFTVYKTYKEGNSN